MHYKQVLRTPCKCLDARLPDDTKVFLISPSVVFYQDLADSLQSLHFVWDPCRSLRYALLYCYIRFYDWQKVVLSRLEWWNECSGWQFCLQSLLRHVGSYIFMRRLYSGFNIYISCGLYVVYVRSLHLGCRGRDNTAQKVWLKPTTSTLSKCFLLDTF